jgi:hypothetical protein
MFDPASFVKRQKIIFVPLLFDVCAWNGAGETVQQALDILIG